MIPLTKKQIINLAIIQSYENITGKKLSIKDIMRLKNGKKEK